MKSFAIIEIGSDELSVIIEEKNSKHEFWVKVNVYSIWYIASSISQERTLANMCSFLHKAKYMYVIKNANRLSALKICVIYDQLYVRKNTYIVTLVISDDPSLIRVFNPRLEIICSRPSAAWLFRFCSFGGDIAFLEYPARTWSTVSPPPLDKVNKLWTQCIGVPLAAATRIGAIRAHRDSAAPVIWPSKNWHLSL